MNDTSIVLGLATAALAGAALGALFFGGLWWTVRRAAASPRPALWFGPSLLLRMTVVVGGFYLVGGAHWPRLAACLLGFVLARIAVLRLSRRRPLALPGGRHAS
ncbi:MAG: ATPase, subunit 2 [Nevskia sp.]|nr:ATPase, subunit 2 [Nevskia sp.]